MIFSLVGVVLLYSSFIAAELYLMFRVARIGPAAPPGDVRVAPPGAGLAGAPAYADRIWQ